MSKLEELKKLVAAAFDKADNKNAIDEMAKINNAIDDAQKEQDELTKKNGELIASYKELVKHTSFKDNKGPEQPVPGGGQGQSLEEALNEFVKNLENKKG